MTADVAQTSKEQTESERRTQAQRTAQSTRLMLAAAGDLIVEKGFSNITLAEIGERAGYSRGLASMRFGSKENLLTALVERITLRWHDRNVLPKIEGQPALDGVVVLIDEIRKQIERDPTSVRVLYSLMFEALSGSPALRAHFVDWNEEKRHNLAELLRTAMADGSLSDDIDPDTEAAVIVGGLRGIAYQWVLDPDGFDPVAPLALLSRTTRQRLSPKLDHEPSKEKP